MLESDSGRLTKLVGAIREHATTTGGDYLQADWYAFYAAIDPK
jgi:hypothetical protein